MAPVPSAPPVATANYANSAGSAGTANYANTAGKVNYTNWGSYASAPYWEPNAGTFYNTSNNLVYNVAVWGTCWSGYPRIYGFTTLGPGQGTYNSCGWAGFTIVGVYTE